MKNPKKDSLVVNPSPGEDFTQTIRRFTKKVRNSGLVQELLSRRYYDKPSVKRKKKQIKARLNRNIEDED